MSESDPLDRLSRVANQSEQPTPEFSDRLLHELLGDLTADGPAPTVSSDHHTINDPTAEVIMLSPDRNQLPERRRAGLLVAASVAAIALIGGLVVVANLDEPAAPVDEPQPTVPEVEPVTTFEDQLAPTAAVISPLPSTGSQVQPGAYTTDLLGIPLTFEVPATLTLDIAGSNIVSMSDDSSDSPRTLSLRRISGWNTPDEAIDQQYAGPGSFDAVDIDAWADANGLDATIPACCRTGSFTGEPLERVGVSVGERSALPLEVRFDTDETIRTFECEDGASCLWAASLSERGTATREGTDLRLASGLVHQLWLITIEGEDPLLIHASSSESDETWVDVIENEVIRGAFGLGPDAPATTGG